MMRLNFRLVGISAAVSALGFSAFAQTPAMGGSPDTSAVQAGNYQVEPDHTQILFSIVHLGFTNFGGVFSKASGSLKLDPKAIAGASVDVTFPVDSVMTTSAKLDGELKSDQWLDAGKYPTMRFQSTQVTQTGPNTATITGNLTFHGVAKPVVLKAKFIGAGTNPGDNSYAIGFAATGVLNRSDFGVKTFVPLISDQVDFTINAAFRK
jgi:polyisoprenoid-binding protein YceI